MAKMIEPDTFCVKTDGFHGKLLRPAQDQYPGKALICSSGSDGGFDLSRMLTAAF